MLGALQRLLQLGTGQVLHFRLLYLCGFLLLFLGCCWSDGLVLFLVRPSFGCWCWGRANGGVNRVADLGFWFRFCLRRGGRWRLHRGSRWFLLFYQWQRRLYIGLYSDHHCLCERFSGHDRWGVGLQADLRGRACRGWRWSFSTSSRFHTFIWTVNQTQVTELGVGGYCFTQKNMVKIFLAYSNRLQKCVTHRFPLLQ